MLHGDTLTRWTLTFGTYDFGGYITEVDPPEPKRNAKERKGGGMPGPVETVHGWEKLRLKFKAVGNREELIELFENNGIGGKRVFLTSAFQDELTNETYTEEHECQGRVLDISYGTRKADEDAEIDVEMGLVYWRNTYKGRVVHELGMLTDVVTVNDKSESDAVNAALGRLT